MTPSVLVLIVATLPGVQDRIETAAAMAKFHRLAAMTTGDRSPQKQRLDALLVYVGKFSERVATDEIKQNEFFNLLQIERDLVDAGTQLAASPEEALCWQRAGLDLARAYHRVAERRVAAGSVPAYTANQSRAQVELFRRQYNHALASCIESQG